MAHQTFLNLPVEKQSRIIESAMEEFVQRSYEKASISRIAENAGIPQGSFYQYFHNKEDLYIECMTVICRKINTAWADKDQLILRTTMHRLATLGATETQNLHQAELEKVLSELDIRFVDGYLSVPRRIRNMVLIEVFAVVTCKYIKKELERDDYFIPGFDPDYLAYLFSMAEFLSTEYVSQRGMASEKITELQMVYLDILYKATMEKQST